MSEQAAYPSARSPAAWPMLSLPFVHWFVPEAGPGPRFWCAGLCAFFGAAGYALGLAGQTAPALVAVGAAYVFGGLRAFIQGLAALRELRPDINFLMILAALVSARLGHWDEGALLLLLFSLSDALERYAVERTRRGVRELMNLRPDSAVLVQDGRETRVPVSQLRIGDAVRIRPGERVPVDGTVIEGTSAVDESIVTGESMPVEKSPGDSVFAGTFNADGSLLVRMLRPPAESTIARIVRLVEQAQERKARAQRTIEAWETPYVWSVLGVCLLAILLQAALLGDLPAAVYSGMVLLVAASPCAVVLASPVAVLAAVTYGARHGVLFKGGAHIDALAAAQTIAFDKTGTLTRGKPVVQRVIAAGGCCADELLALCAAVESHSEHPLAKAIVAHARQRGLNIAHVEDFMRLPGVGVCGRVQGRFVRAGRFGDSERETTRLPPELLARLDELAGQTTILVTIDDQVCGLLALSDSLRPEAAAALHALRRLGIRRFVLLTGDQAQPAALVAQELHLDETLHSLRPEEKVEQVRRLAARDAGVVMVGDGVNDAPALAAATVGVAMGAAGSDVALETADVVLMPDDLIGLPKAIHLARRCRGVIRQSLTFAFSMIALLVALTLLSITAWHATLPLPLAVLGHEGSTVLVVLNGLRLLRERPVPGLSAAAAPAR